VSEGEKVGWGVLVTAAEGVGDFGGVGGGCSETQLGGGGGWLSGGEVPKIRVGGHLKRGKP